MFVICNFHVRRRWLGSGGISEMGCSTIWNSFQATEQNPYFFKVVTRQKVLLNSFNGDLSSQTTKFLQWWSVFTVLMWKHKLGHELHRELLGVLAFEACKVKFKSKGAHHTSLKKFWASSTERFLKHLQAKKKKEAPCTFQIWKKYQCTLKTQKSHKCLLTVMTELPLSRQFIKVAKEKRGSRDWKFLCSR